MIKREANVGRHGWLARTAVAVALLAAAAPLGARELGPVPLVAIMDLAKPYPNLLLEIRLQLVAANVKREQVNCSAERLGPEWAQLAGVRRGPYACQIGKRRLTVTGVAGYHDKAGHRIKPNDATLAARAAKLTEARLKWQWK